MKKNLLFSIALIISFLFTGHTLYAQQWSYHNPTSGFDVNAIDITGPGVIVIGGGRETRDSVQIMFQTTDYGLTWHENPHDGFAPWNKSVAFSDALHGLGVGYDGRIITTYDAGRNWGYPASPVNRDLNKIVFVDGTYFIAGGNKTRDSLQTILKSTNSGNTWNVIFDTPGYWLRSLYFLDTLKGFAVGDNGVILSTTDGGNTWASIPSPVQRDFIAITFINADTGYITGGNSPLPFKMTILRTADGGISWSVLKDTTGGMLRDISFADTLTGYIVGDNATVLKTTDGGLNWSPVVIGTNLTGYETFNAVKFYNRNFGAIGGKNGLVYVYQDLPVDVFTLGSNCTGNTDASLSGGINTHSKNVGYSFVYSVHNDFSTYDSTTEIQVRNDSLLLVSEYTHGLTPNTTYYFFLKAVTPAGTIYGDTLSFYTGANQGSVFQTVYATGIGISHACLNGLIGNFQEPVSLFFEYGHSPTFGSQIAANPATVSNTLLYEIQGNISGLQANTRYFFRLKGVTASGTFYGDTKMFYAMNLPEAGTINVNIISLTSVNLNGSVTNNGLPSAMRFEYGPTSQYGNEVVAVPDTVRGTAYVGVNCVLTGLSPAVHYHFRTKAVNPNGTGYGLDRTFFTGGAIAITSPASYIGTDAARLNGTVNAKSFSTAVKFEYGLTEQYGNEVAASPDTAFGTVNVDVYSSMVGLSPLTTYHFRLKAVNSNGITYGADMMFTTGSPYASTLPATNTGAVSTQLNGLVNAHNNATINRFEYGFDTNYGNEVTAIPDSAAGNSDVNIFCHLSGLLPGTTYYYRVKSSNSTGTSYGNCLTFATLSNLLSATTLSPTDVTPNSARLNGLLDLSGIPTAISFEYGTSESYGNEIIATPDSSSAIGSINVFSTLSGLIPNTSYHFRLKGSNNLITKFGEDKIFYTGNPEIPNFDFESWTPVTKTKPEGYDLVIGKISKYTPACHGNFAVKMENDTVFGGLPGALVIGTVIDYHTFLGGAPFNGRPDTLKGCFNYYIRNNDTALIILMLKKQGEIISNNLFKISGNSSGNYTDLKFPIKYSSYGNADSVIFGIAASDFRNDPQHFSGGSYLILDQIRFSGTTENLPNNDFENWCVKTVYPPDNWCCGTNPLHPEDTVIMRSSDAQHGSFAARVKNFIYTTDTMGGWLSSSTRWDIPGFSVSGQHQSLTGYYRFLPENNDTLMIQARMFKNHLPIGGGMMQSNIPVYTYTPFIINIDYFTTDIPDSVTITFQAYNCWPPLGNSVLYIDNLNYDGFLSGVKEPVLPASGNFDFKVYPNPFSEQATVSFHIIHDEFADIRLFDVSGKQVVLLANKWFKTGDYSITLPAAGLKTGFYFCVIHTGNRVSSKKLIIY